MTGSVALGQRDIVALVCQIVEDGAELSAVVAAQHVGIAQDDAAGGKLAETVVQRVEVAAVVVREVEQPLEIAVGGLLCVQQAAVDDVFSQFIDTTSPFSLTVSSVYVS